MRMLSFQFSVLCSALAVAVVGCGGKSGPPLGVVTGTITVNGEPAPGVMITFIPQGKGSPSYGGTNEDGVYRLMFNQNRSGAEIGAHTVIIESPEPETDDSGIRIDEAAVVSIPKKYRQPGVLTAEVDSGRNRLDFDLDAKE